jgi:hypothetical protein
MICALEVQLGYLADEKVPLDMVFTSGDVHNVKSSKLGQVVIDKLSKVKGKKVRKNLITLLEGLLERLVRRYPESRESVQSEYRVKLMILHFNYHLVISELCEPGVQVKAFIDLHFERVLFCFDQLRTTVLACKYLILQLAAKSGLPEQLKHHLSELELLRNVLDRMNVNQMRKTIPGLYKDKFFCCISHHAYGKAPEDHQWLQVEAEAVNQMVAIAGLTRA